MDKWDEIVKDGNTCKACSLGRIDSSRCIIDGDDFQGHRPILFISDVPSITSDLLKVTDSIGLSSSSYYVVPIVQCFSTAGTAEYGDFEIASCKQFLGRKIDHMKPSVLISMGAHAAELLMGKKPFPITKWSGKGFTSHFKVSKQTITLQCYVMPSLNGALRGKAGLTPVLQKAIDGLPGWLGSQSISLTKQNTDKVEDVS